MKPSSRLAITRSIGRAIVTVLDAGRVNLPTESQLNSAFGLSRGEARLAIRLAASQTLDSAAGVCGISYETARKRLKAVFDKTDTRRQSELVALIIRIAMPAGAGRVVAAEATLRRSRDITHRAASAA